MKTYVCVYGYGICNKVTSYVNNFLSEMSQVHLVTSRVHEHYARKSRCQF